jgi:hypothetical protein
MALTSDSGTIKIKKKEINSAGTGSMAPMVEHFPSMHKAQLDLVLTTKNK